LLEVVGLMDRLLQGLQLTAVGMLVVFGALYALTLIMQISGAIFSLIDRAKRSEPPQGQDEMTESQDGMEEGVEQPEAQAAAAGVSPATVAAITAALATYLKQSSRDIGVVRITRVQQPSSLWSAAGRQEVVR
jgi:sodium pump decarboxylase gamma subunit